MGKRLLQQRRGRGTSNFRSPGFKYKGRAKHRQLSKEVRGKIVDLIDCPGHSAPLAKITYEDGQACLTIAPEGIAVGDTVTVGGEAKPGNLFTLKDIPEGALVFNIELQPGDGGKFVRSSGTFAKVVAKTPSGVTVKLPSKKEKTFFPECRACIGVVAGGGRPEKFFLKAGTKYYHMKAKNKIYPHVQGISMNAVAHPFGSKSSHIKGRPTQSSRHDPPGRKVGKIAPRRTGRRKR
ncbi:MAG: 50S ribosomal protein L2 [Nanoarchaeota archaeon]|nr:50S ribosomal protein L2 [Nanoarchaeota archaeon]